MRSVGWSRTKAGRRNAQLGRKDQTDGPLGQCMVKQFEHWRYPRTPREFMNVEQAFTVVRARAPELGRPSVAVARWPGSRALWCAEASNPIIPYPFSQSGRAFTRSGDRHGRQPKKG